jgi:hypothetical protein
VVTTRWTGSSSRRSDRRSPTPSRGTAPKQRLPREPSDGLEPSTPSLPLQSFAAPPIRLRSGNACVMAGSVFGIPRHRRARFGSARYRVGTLAWPAARDPERLQPASTWPDIRPGCRADRRGCRPFPRCSGNVRTSRRSACSADDSPPRGPCACGDRHARRRRRSGRTPVRIRRASVRRRGDRRSRRALRARPLRCRSSIDGVAGLTARSMSVQFSATSAPQAGSPFMTRNLRAGTWTTS